MSHVGNPDDDGYGYPVWQMDYVQGGALGSDNPWFEEPGAKMVWDSAWFEGAGRWARGDDFNPQARPESAAAIH